MAAASCPQCPLVSRPCSSAGTGLVTGSLVLSSNPGLCLSEVGPGWGWRRRRQVSSHLPGAGTSQAPFLRPCVVRWLPRESPLQGLMVTRRPAPPGPAWPPHRPGRRGPWGCGGSRSSAPFTSRGGSSLRTAPRGTRDCPTGPPSWGQAALHGALPARTAVPPRSGNRCGTLPAAGASAPVTLWGAGEAAAGWGRDPRPPCEVALG